MLSPNTINFWSFSKSFNTFPLSFISIKILTPTHTYILMTYLNKELKMLPKWFFFCIGLDDNKRTQQTELCCVPSCLNKRWNPPPVILSTKSGAVGLPCMKVLPKFGEISQFLLLVQWHVITSEVLSWWHVFRIQVPWTKVVNGCFALCWCSKLSQIAEHSLLWRMGEWTYKDGVCGDIH